MGIRPGTVCPEEINAISTNFRHNEQIRISPIRLINDKEEQVGIVSTNDALRMAREAGLDLVEVAPTARPPVCRIMDYGKWRYQQQKKEDKSRASSRGGRLKQINIDTIRIGDHDLEIKVNRARDFLKEGNKVQFTLRFKGREMAHLDLGRNLFLKIKHLLFLESKVERDAKMEGKRMSLVLQPDHKDPAKTKIPDLVLPPPRINGPMNVPAYMQRNRPPAPSGPISRPPGGPVGPGINRPAGTGPVGPGINRPAGTGPVGPGINRPVGAPAPGVAAPRPASSTPAPAAPAPRPAPAGT